MTNPFHHNATRKPEGTAILHCTFTDVSLVQPPVRFHTRSASFGPLWIHRSFTMSASSRAAAAALKRAVTNDPLFADFHWNDLHWKLATVDGPNFPLVSPFSPVHSKPKLATLQLHHLCMAMSCVRGCDLHFHTGESIHDFDTIRLYTCTGTGSFQNSRL